MFELGSVARWVVMIGIAITVIGLLIGVASRVPGLDRLGRLPGDIRYTSPGGSMTCFVPLASSIILSIILTIVLNVIVRLLNR